MLDDLISGATLEDLAGTTAFGRGEEYFSAGTVGRLRIIGDKITARVEGSEIYRVELQKDDGELAYDCTCPRAAIPGDQIEGSFVRLSLSQHR